MRSKFVRRLACAGAALLLVASTATAQVTNFSTDVNSAIDAGLAWLDANGAYGVASSAGDAAGLAALAILEQRISANQNALSQGYAGATPADQVRIQNIITWIIANHAPSSFYAYRDGADMMALSVYLRSGGPSQAAASAALNAIFDRTIAAQAVGPPFAAYWCYTGPDCADASTTQFAMAGLAAARGVYSDPMYSDPGRLASLNTATGNARTAYAGNGLAGESCSAGGILTLTERGHGYNLGNCNSIQQTASGIWVQVVGGDNLNSAGVQGYLEWLRNRYRYSGISASSIGQFWPSYYYYMWAQSKALSFLDDSGVMPTGTNLSTAALGTLAPGSAPAFADRQLHRNPTTDPRVPARCAVPFACAGAELGPYYNDPNETARWYYDGAYTLLTHQIGSGQFSNPESGWESFSDQSYALLYLERSIGGGCNDTDGDGICDSEDNCPNVSNHDQADADDDGTGDACEEACMDTDGDGVCDAHDNCPLVSNHDQADANHNGVGDACEPKPGRMAGSAGSLITGGLELDTFDIHCNAATLPNSLKVIWGRNNFLLLTVTSASCSNDPAIAYNPPGAGFDTLDGTGVGNYNGIPGATITFKFTDEGKPGANKDSATIVIKDAGNNTVLSMSGKIFTGEHTAYAK